MAITKNLVVTLKNDIAKPKEKMFVYRDDVGIEMVIELKDFNYSIDAVENRNNIQKAYALFRTPANKTYRYTNIKISDGKLVFMFSQDIVNVMQEIGEYELQFQLYDKENNRLTIPSYNFYVKEPLTIDGELVDTAVVDESIIVDFGEEQEYIFIITDGYIKTEWKTGDLITKERLNKVENALSVITDAVNLKAEISQLHNHENKEILDTISANKINEWDNKSNFDGDYNSLTNKPTIPSLNGYATEQYVNEEIEKIDVTEQLTDYAKKSDLEVKADKSYVDSAIESVDVSSQLTNYATKSELLSKVDKVTGKSLISDSEIERLSTLNNYDDTDIKNTLNSKANKTDLHSHANKTVLDGITSAKVNEWNNKSTFDGNYNNLTNKPTIPTKTSQLTNDSGFMTTVPSEYITETELSNKGYLTQHQDLSSYAKKTDLHSHSNKSVLDGITADKITEWDNKSTFDGNYNSLTNKPTIPTKTSQLTNDSGFITTVPSEYITETELNAKGYLTQHQDISHKVDKISGYSLVSDTEISRLATLENYDDTEIRGLINKTNTSLERSVKFKVVGEGATVPPLENAESHSHSNKTVLDSISSAKITEWDNKSDFSGNYNDLTNKPAIPKASNYKTAYGTCPSTASTSEKTVVIDDPNWELEVGNIVAIMFSDTNTASNVTLNVNNTGAYPIWYSTSEYTSNSNTVCGSANLLITFMFNGTHWVWLARGTYSSYSPATLGQGYGVCDTAESTLAKASTISSYTLVVGGIVSIKFTNAVPANSTLNIRTRGAKKIFYRGVAIIDGIIKAGDIATFIYDGTQYHLISLDNAVGNIPTKTSQLTNDSGFLTSVPSEYVTETELNSKGYLTQHQDISSKADKTELHSHTNKTVLDSISSAKVTEWNNKSDFSGNYNDLTNRPTIPTKTSQLTNDSNFISSVPSEYVTETELNTALEQFNPNSLQQVPLYANSIEECTDTTKCYVLPDGFIYAFKQVNKVISGQPKNVISSSTDADGVTPYNGGLGYKVGVRLSGSSGEEAYSGNANQGVSGFIKCKPGDVLRITGFKGISGVASYVISYDSSRAVLKNTQNTNWMVDTELPDYAEITLDSATFGDFSYIRISLNYLNGNTFATINEPITGETIVTKEEKWESTGHAFVPADYDNEIAQMKTQISSNSSAIAEIVNGGSTPINTRAKTLMYVSPNGDDNNDGLTENKPKLTFQACIDAGATKISAKRGIYKKGISKVISNNDVEIEIYPTDNDKNRDIGETFDPIVIDLSDEILATDFISYNSIKRVAYSNSNNVPIKKVFVDKAYNPQYSNGSDYGSRWNATIWLLSDDGKTVHKLKPVLTIAECESTSGTFTYDGSYIYANADWTNITKVNVPYDYYNGILLQGFSKIKLIEVEVRFTGSYCFDLKACPNVELHKCSSKYTLYGSGFHPYNVNGVFKNCYATKCYDGFGISASGHTTYIDCISEFNFDDGASNHNTSEGTFIGGRYEGNGKAGNAPAYGCKVNIIGGLYKNNSIGIGYLSATGEGHADGMIQNAIIVGNTTGLTVNKDCNVICTTSYFEGNTTQKDIKGNLTEYGNTIK